MTPDPQTRAPALTPGFADTVTDSQIVFRAVLDAMSRPGTLQTIELALEGPETLDIAATALALALIDYETPLYLSPSLATPASETYLKFHCGTRITKASREAAFAILDGAPDEFGAFNTGSDEYPETGATLVIQVDTIETDGPLLLTGPGIKDSSRINLPDISQAFWAKRTAQQRHFPRGLDFVFVSGTAMLALPRTTTVSVATGKD